jgi:hypothetical protein
MLKRVLMGCAAILFAACMVTAGQYAADQQAPAKAPAAKSWTGYITDDHCKTDRHMGDAAECVKKCVGGGGKYALYVPAAKKTYVLDPQDQAADHAGHHVKVSGTVDGDTIHVTSITMVGAKKAAQKSGS